MTEPTQVTLTKRPYRQPRLTVHGTVAEVTAGLGNSPQGASDAP
jgi:hypothetical protein